MRLLADGLRLLADLRPGGLVLPLPVVVRELLRRDLAENEARDVQVGGDVLVARLKSEKLLVGVVTAELEEEDVAVVGVLQAVVSAGVCASTRVFFTCALCGRLPV